MNKVYVLFFVLLSSLACTDTFMAGVSAYGDPATIECYSGNKLIYKGESTGKVSSPAQSDGYRFMEKATGRLVEVSGNCVIRVN